MLQLFGLTKEFGNLTAVRGLSFDVGDGEIVGLLGPNGAGKTTTIRCIAGILKPTTGRIHIDGQDLATSTDAAKRSLAYVPEVPNLYEMLTVQEHVRFISAAYGLDDDLETARALLERMDLWDKRGDLVGSLSKGMKQKLACVCAFVHRPSVYCFDEPLIGMDPRGAREFKDLLAEYRREGKAILVSTHMLDTAERLCDRVIIMNRGEKLAEGTVAQLHEASSLAGDATLEDVFLRMTSGE